MQQLKRESLVKLSGVVTIVSGVLLLLWWGLMVIPMPAPGSKTLLLDMVTHRAWVPLNAVGSFATMLLPLALVGLYAMQSDRFGMLGMLGFLLSFLGSLLYMWIQVDETVLWPLLAAHTPELVDMDGPMFADPVFSATYVLMGALYIPGVIAFGIAMFRARLLPRAGVVLFALGAAVFGIGGPLFVVRTLGVILQAAGLVWLGRAQWKRASLYGPAEAAVCAPFHDRRGPSV